LEVWLQCGSHESQWELAPKSLTCLNTPTLRLTSFIITIQLTASWR